MTKPHYIEPRWAITTPGVPSDDGDFEFADGSNYEFADGSKWIEIWDPNYFGGPTLDSRDDVERFIADVRKAADIVWPK